MPPRDQGPSSAQGASASPYRGPGSPSDPLNTGDLIVEYPATSPTALRRGKGVSMFGVFLLAIVAQLMVLGAVAGLAIAFPQETSTLLAQARMQLALPSSASLTEGGGMPGDQNRTEARLEILRLEDRAIFRRDREAWDRLEQKLAQLPSSHSDYEAVQASLIRIRVAYELPELLEPPLLDPREVFPTAATEADIPLASLIQVLHDSKQSESKRQRCAYLLQKENSPAARSALFQSIQEDPSLMVVQQAFQSFRNVTGYPGKNCFDAQSVARWWGRNAHAALGQN